MSRKGIGISKSVSVSKDIYSRVAKHVGEVFGMNEDLTKHRTVL